MYYSDENCEDRLLAQLLEEAKGYVDSGYQILKIKVGKNMAFDENLIREFRSNFSKIKLAADANHAYQFKEAIRVGKWLEECDYSWFEVTFIDIFPILLQMFDSAKKISSFRLWTFLQ